MSTTKLLIISEVPCTMIHPEDEDSEDDPEMFDVCSLGILDEVGQSVQFSYFILYLFHTFLDLLSFFS